MPVMQNLEFRCVTKFPDLNKPVFKRREERVASYFAFDECEVKVGTARQRLLVNLRAAANENFIGEFRWIQPLQRVENQNFRLLFFPQLAEMKLVGTFEVTPAAPLVILSENFGMLVDKPLRVPGQDEILPVRQRLSQTFKRLPAHDDNVAWLFP